jgi:hypothetical protein
MLVFCACNDLWRNILSALMMESVFSSERFVSIYRYKGDINQKTDICLQMIFKAKIILYYEKSASRYYLEDNCFA